MNNIAKIGISKPVILVISVLTLSFALPSFSETLSDLWDRLMGRTPPVGSVPILKCPEPADVAESLRQLRKDRGGRRSLAGFGVTIKGGSFTVEDIVGVLHFPILANDPNHWDNLKLEGDFKKQLLEMTRKGAAKGLKVCGYIQVTEMGPGEPEDVTIVYLTYKK